MKLFERNPHPWRYEPNFSECGNGSRIAGIVDANGECVVSSYGSVSGIDALWDLYLVLTDDQMIKLGAWTGETDDRG